MRIAGQLIEDMQQLDRSFPSAREDYRVQLINAVFSRARSVATDHERVDALSRLEIQHEEALARADSADGGISELINAGGEFENVQDFITQAHIGVDDDADREFERAMGTPHLKEPS